MIVDQYRTEDVLRKHLVAYGVQVELGTEPIAAEQDTEGVTVTDRKSTRLNSSHSGESRMPSSA